MKSKCCGLRMIVVHSPSGEGTRWWVCSKCGEPCDPKVDTSPTSRLERKHYLSPNKKPVTAKSGRKV